MGFGSTVKSTDPPNSLEPELPLAGVTTSLSLRSSPKNGQTSGPDQIAFLRGLTTYSTARARLTELLTKRSQNALAGEAQGGRTHTRQMFTGGPLTAGSPGSSAGGLGRPLDLGLDGAAAPCVQVAGVASPQSEGQEPD